MVRSPRVGDRIDVDLPVYLVEALPQLSEQALIEAAQPLDDLEEHRRSVAETSRTLEAVEGILSVYRSYCNSDLKKRVHEGRDRLEARHRCARDEKRRQQQSETAAAEVRQTQDQIAALDERAKRLRIEIAALKDSPVYKDGQQLVDLRRLVDDLRRQAEEADARVADRAKSLEPRGQRGARRAHSQPTVSRRAQRLLGRCLTTRLCAPRISAASRASRMGRCLPSQCCPFGTRSGRRYVSPASDRGGGREQWANEDSTSSKWRML